MVKLICSTLTSGRLRTEVVSPLAQRLFELQDGGPFEERTATLSESRETWRRQVSLDSESVAWRT